MRKKLKKSKLPKLVFFSLMGAAIIAGISGIIGWGGIFNFNKYVLAEHKIRVELDKTFVSAGSQENYNFSLANEGSDLVYSLAIEAPEGFQILKENIVCPSGWIMNPKSSAGAAICFTDPDPAKEKVLRPGSSVNVSFSAISARPESDTEYSWQIKTKDSNLGISYNNEAKTKIDVEDMITEIIENLAEESQPTAEEEILEPENTEIIEPETENLGSTNAESELNNSADLEEPETINNEENASESAEQEEPDNSVNDEENTETNVIAENIEEQSGADSAEGEVDSLPNANTENESTQ